MLLEGLRVHQTPRLFFKRVIEDALSSRLLYFVGLGYVKIKIKLKI